jgi:FkbM family methyltransferase
MKSKTRRYPIGRRHRAVSLRHLPFAVLRAYARIAPTERGGFRLARAARRLIPRAGWRDVFATGEGVRLALDLGTYPDVAMAAGLYELETARLLRRIVRPGMHVVDGGANLGFFTCRLGALVGPQGRVDAFEPDPLNRRRLGENLERNETAAPVRVHALALSDRAERVTFHRPAPGTRRNHGESSRFPRGDVPTVAFEVEAKRLDEAIEGVPQIVKLDLEGSELLALRGATRWLGSQRPPIWIIEHNPGTESRAEHRAADLWRELGGGGRYACMPIGSGEALESPEELDSVHRQLNLLFLPVCEPAPLLRP